jgi:hypothetical protein
VAVVLDFHGLKQMAPGTHATGEDGRDSKKQYLYAENQ